MRYQNCKFGEKCRYFHPRRLKNVSHNRENKTEKPFINKERPSYANIARKSLQPQMQYLQPQMQSNAHFLGLTPPVHQASLTHQTFLDIPNKQKEMMELFMSLNQKVTNMVNMKM